MTNYPVIIIRLDAFDRRIEDKKEVRNVWISLKQLNVPTRVRSKKT